MGRTESRPKAEVDAVADVYRVVASQIEAGEEHLDHVFTVGAQRILARIDRSEQRRGMRR